jgi:hypothetical protein
MGDRSERRLTVLGMQLLVAVTSLGLLGTRFIHRISDFSDGPDSGFLKASLVHLNY